MKPYNPFEDESFQSDICFLTGQRLDKSNIGYISAMPQWLINRYQLQEQTISMLGGNRLRYSDMRLPASPEVVAAVAALDHLTQEAFTEGFSGVKKLSELQLFQWMARVLYGVLYQDFLYTIGRHQAREKIFRISPLMMKKIKNLHLMLQSLLRPIQFENFTPWSICCFPVNYSKDLLNYKDETHKLNFCLGMNGFAIIACLQDNGEIAQFHEDLLQQIGTTRLHPAQLEELYGRFMYANWLLREAPDYECNVEGETIRLWLPDNHEITVEGKPKYAEWQEDIFAQVLANMWEPWGIQMKDIHNFPNAPISYLINEFDHSFIDPKSVNLPY